ncbi:MAG: hypothetical protein Kow001_25740 [Acidobacteriota bacterium]
MFRRVLVASDLSPPSDRVLDCVAGWKGVGLQKVIIANVHNLIAAAGLEEELRRDHAPKLEAQAQRLRDAGSYASWRLEFGVPSLEIQRLAEEEGAEVVVIGSHGASWVKEIWLTAGCFPIWHIVWRSSMSGTRSDSKPSPDSCRKSGLPPLRGAS